jgi:fatty acid desaturase (delta-4 desaturase)
MPPDADQLRQRKAHQLEDKLDAAATQERICSLKSLSGNEICIEGVIYDISNFDHPGGETIKIFGGNDVTVKYKMIHPYHTAKHLEKMQRVGKVTDWSSEYKWDSPFEREIKKEVFKIVRRGKEFATPGYIFRAIFYIGLFFTLQYMWAFNGSTLPLAIVYGMAAAFIGLNVQHDANHGAVSKKSWINDVMGLGADFIGGSKWLWIEQHWTHHAYTNHAQKDPDAYGAEPMLIFNDYPLGHPARTFMHKFQCLFYAPVMAGYWISSVFNPQILDLNQRGAASIGMRFDNDFVIRRRKWAVALRLLYIVTNIVTPFLHHDWKTAIFHIAVMSVSESLTLALPFSLSHNFVNADRDPTAHFRKTGEQVDWFKAQVETSCTYGGAISGYITGGLNFQVEHHLFPRMSSAWYPYIAPKVREICEKHGVNYAYYPWVHQNFYSTMKYLNAAGNGSNWLENPYTGN